MRAEQPTTGLRHRKQLAAMRRIQEVALGLFDERGYGSVAIEQIAEASEVSPSSVYRYFGTKEQLVLWKEFDPVIAERLQGELDTAPPLVAARRVMMGVMAEMVGDERSIQRRIRHIMSDPGLEAAFARQMYVVSQKVGEIFADRLRRPAEDLEVQVLSHAIVGALQGGLHHWHGSGFRTPLVTVWERTLDLFEAGLAVGTGDPMSGSSSAG